MQRYKSKKKQRAKQTEKNSTEQVAAAKKYLSIEFSFISFYYIDDDDLPIW